jgi:ketosteroid isomerase-like protein
MGIRENKAIVERFDRLTGACELDGLDQLCTPEMVNHALATHRPPGLAGTKQFLAESESDPGKAAWRRSLMFAQRVVTVAEGEYVTQLGTRAGRWPGGRFRGIEIPGGDYEYEVAFMYRLRDGRIAERWAVRDDLGMILQLTNAAPQSVIDAVAQTETAPTRAGGRR